MKLRIVMTIMRKELLETLRDKRSLVALIGVPVLLYPLMLIVGLQGVSLQQDKVERADSMVAVVEGGQGGDNVGGEGGEVLRSWLGAIEKVRLIESDDPLGQLQVGELDAVVTAEGDLVAAVGDPGSGDGDLAAALGGRGSADIRIDFDATEMPSRQAKQRIVDALTQRGDELLAARLATAGLDADFAHPLNLHAANVATAKKQTGSVLGATLPVLLIVMLGVGAFYPAVDLTAGEKERGTFETLLSTPTTKLEIVCGKFATIFCLSMLTALLNLTSMICSILFVVSRGVTEFAAKGDGFELSLVQLSPLNIVLIFLVLVPLAFFICSVMMGVAILARDFKEAQNYVTPFFIVIMLPGFFTALPGVELTRATMFIPIANVALLFKQLLIDQSSLEYVFGVLFSTCVWAMLALLAASWLFQREQVILAEEKGLPLTWRRSVFTPRRAPTIGMALTLYGLVLLILFYAATYVQQRDVLSGLVITQWVLLLLPAVFLLWYFRVDLRHSLSLRRPPLLSVLVTLVMAAGCVILVIKIGHWQQRVLPVPEALEEQMKLMLSGEQHVAVLLLIIAFSPAVCEEVLFRGAILSGVRSRMAAVPAAVVVGVLFGLFHISIHRVLPTALLGIAIGYMTVRWGSIFVAMLFHFIVNATVVLIETEHVPARMIEYFESEGFEQHSFSLPVVLLAGLLVVAAIVLTEMFGRQREVGDGTMGEQGA